MPEETPPEGVTPPTGPSADDLAKVQAALDKERELRKTAEREAREGKAAMDRLAELDEAQKSEIEKAFERGRTEGRTESQKVANERLVASEARAIAAESKFRNPATAVRLLDLSSIPVSDDGSVDSAAVKALLADLGEAEPYLLAEEAPPLPTANQVGIGVIGNGAPTDPIAADMAQIAADVAKATKK